MKDKHNNDERNIVRLLEVSARKLSFLQTHKPFQTSWQDNNCCPNNDIKLSWPPSFSHSFQQHLTTSHTPAPLQTPPLVFPAHSLCSSCDLQPRDSRYSQNIQRLFDIFETRFTWTAFDICESLMWHISSQFILTAKQCAARLVSFNSVFLRTVLDTGEIVDR